MKKTLKSGKVVKIQLDRMVWTEVASLVDTSITRLEDYIIQLQHLEHPTNNQLDLLDVAKQELIFLKQAQAEFEDKLHES